MAEPGSAWDGDNQPAHMDDYVQTMSDNGGVHINSGIPNKAFAELGLRLGGPAWERAGRIWYDVSVVADGRRHHVRLGERELDENLRALIDRLERAAAPEADQP